MDNWDAEQPRRRWRRGFIQRQGYSNDVEHARCLFLTRSEGGEYGETCLYVLYEYGQMRLSRHPRSPHLCPTGPSGGDDPTSRGVPETWVPSRLRRCACVLSACALQFQRLVATAPWGRRDSFLPRRGPGGPSKFGRRISRGETKGERSFTPWAASPGHGWAYGAGGSRPRWRILRWGEGGQGRERDRERDREIEYGAGLRIGYSARLIARAKPHCWIAACVTSGPLRSFEPSSDLPACLARRPGRRTGSHGAIPALWAWPPWGVDRIFYTCQLYLNWCKCRKGGVFDLAKPLLSIIKIALPSGI